MKVLFLTAPELNRRSYNSLLIPSASAYLTGKMREEGIEVVQIDLDAVFVHKTRGSVAAIETPFVNDYKAMFDLLKSQRIPQGIVSLISDLVAAIPRDNYGLIGVSARRAPGTAVLTELLKKRFQSPIVLGGHIDVDVFEFMRVAKCADMFCKDMGELLLPKIAKSLQTQSEPASLGTILVRREDDLVMVSDGEATIHDRAFPDPQGLDIKLYMYQPMMRDMLPNPGARLVLPVQSVQGCPFACSYCRFAADGRPRVIARSPKCVASDIAFAYSLGIRDFAFVDNTINATRTYP